MKIQFRFLSIILIQTLLAACATRPAINDKTSETPPTAERPKPEKPVGQPTVHLPTHRRPPVPQKERPTGPDPQAKRDEQDRITNTPFVIPGTVSLNETFFVVQYDAKLSLPREVTYFLSGEKLKHNFVKRKDHFHADLVLPNLGLSSEGPESFGEGYDRGHMAPAGDFAWSEDADEATFTMANMTPQTANLNRHAWEALEEAVREFACAEGMIEVASGPVIVEGEELSRLQKNGVAIPKRFFKVVLDETLPKKAIGFIMNQEDADRHEFEREVYPLSEIEKITKIRFFDDLKDGPERIAIESKADLTEWHREKCVGTLRAESAEATDPDKGWEQNEVAVPRGKQRSQYFDQDEDLPKFKTRSSYRPRKARTRTLTCETGELRAASISGCCRGHQGVMGPKHEHACCDDQARVLCNDGAADARCSCQ